MIPKYIVTLALTVCLVTCAVSWLLVVTGTTVLAGKAVDETLNLRFTVDDANGYSYAINPSYKQFLEEHISFYTEGAARVVSAKVEITPKVVTWTKPGSTITKAGAVMSARFRWDTPADSADGAYGKIYLHFPEVPGLEGKVFNFHSDEYQVDGKGRCLLREVTTCRSAFTLFQGTFVPALAAGLPLGVLLHTIYWAFVLKGEKRSRLAERPPQGDGFPQTFYSNPITEWIVWLLIIGCGALVACVMVVSSDTLWTAFSWTMPFLAGAPLAAYFTAQNALTVRVDTQGISYARGRGDLQWRYAAWTDILRFRETYRTTRGTKVYSIELEFNDKRELFKVSQAWEGYPLLRETLVSVFATKPS